jgi:SAM-dependent methyltransferase/peroxiredoxin
VAGIVVYPDVHVDFLFALLLVLVTGAGPFRSAIDLEAYDRFVGGSFEGVHRSLAKQVVDDYGLDRGRSLEIAFGAPYVSIELARASSLEFDVLVAGSTELALARHRVDESGLAARFRFHVGSPESLPFEEGKYDLVLARDAMRFWPSKAVVFTEVNRVLRTGGTALLGGGLGRGYGVRDAARFWSVVQDWRNRTGPLPWAATSPYPENLEASMDSTGIPEFRVWTEGGYCNCRTWVEWTRSPEVSEPSGAVPGDAGGRQVDTPAPGFALVDCSGDTICSEELLGRVVVLDFWGVDCRACLNMMGMLRPFWDSLPPGECEVLAINVDLDESLFFDFVHDKGTLGYRMLYGGAEAAEDYGVRGLPHFIVLDRASVIRARVKGSTPGSVQELRDAVARLVGRD